MRSTSIKSVVASLSIVATLTAAPIASARPNRTETRTDKAVRDRSTTQIDRIAQATRRLITKLLGPVTNEIITTPIPGPTNSGAGTGSGSGNSK